MTAAAAILTIPQAAERLGKSRWTIRRAANATGEIVPGVKVFRICSTDYVSAEQLDRFLAGTTAGAS